MDQLLDTTDGHEDPICEHHKRILPFKGIHCRLCTSMLQAKLRRRIRFLNEAAAAAAIERPNQWDKTLF